MNVFVIPSWYPSETNPSYGIFIKEQVTMMARLQPQWKIGVSLWGQGKDEKLLWVKDHFKNVSKLKRHSLDVFSKKENSNLIEYYQPALSWTKKFKQGNLNEIVRCNELNFQHYVLEFGPPDILLVQASYPGALIGSYLSEKYDIPYAVHVRLGGFMFRQLLNEVGSMKVELLDAINSANQVFVTSEFQCKELSQWIPEVTVIHNPVDTSFFEVNESDDQYALSIGRLEDEKGFDLLLDAVKNIPAIKLKIVGTGSRRKALEKQAKENQLGDKVEFLGELDRVGVRNAIMSCKFLVLPSKYETFGNVLLEAMSCGKPVVATKCGGPEEIVSSQTGLLCETTQEDLSEKISEMIETVGLFKAADIRKELEDRFSPNVWMSQLSNHFKSLVYK